MLCLRRLIYSCFAFCVFLFISCFFLSSPSYATSHVITCNTLSCYNQQIKLTHTDSSVGFSFSYVSVEIQADKSLTNFNLGSFYNNTNKFILINSSGYVYDLFSTTDSYFKLSANWNSWLSNDSLPWTFTLSFYDSNPVVPCDCPDCPEVPENPYDDKLDELIHAVYVVGAILLVIYFFYIMYSWYIRS